MNPVITIRHDVLGGTPCFAGTRVPADTLFEYLADGQSIVFFLEQFPSVTRRQVETLLEESKQRAIAAAKSIEAA